MRRGRRLLAAALLQAACSAPDASGGAGASGGGTSGGGTSGGSSSGAASGGALVSNGAGGVATAGVAGGFPSAGEGSGAALPGAGTAGAAGTVAAAGATGMGGAASALAQYATIREIITFKCGGAGCHSGEMAPRLVDDDQLSGTLRSFVAQRCGNRPLVVPGSPEGSAFYLAQRGECAPQLPLMPLGCVDNCTPPDYVDAVRAWIASGAPMP